MAWYEAHQTLAKHPKTLRLASLLKCERRYAVGLLHDLFSWGLDAAKKDGSLPGLSADEIAIALDFSGKKGTDAVSALLKSGYLENVDGTFKIHDWYDYAGKFADQREDAKKRKDAWKERKLNGSGTRTELFQNSSGTVPERGKNAPTVPNRTVPNNTEDMCVNARARACARETPQQQPPDPDRWEEFWSAYPRKSGGDIREACMEYIAIIDHGVDPETLISAAKALAKRTTPDAFRYLPSAEKWLRNKGWLENPEAAKDTRTNNVFLQMYEDEYGGDGQ